jgi:hypothetical protein
MQYVKNWQYITAATYERDKPRIEENVSSVPQHNNGNARSASSKLNLLKANPEETTDDHPQQSESELDTILRYLQYDL